jgi:hypothetical protein
MSESEGGVQATETSGKQLKQGDTQLEKGETTRF